MNKHVRIATHVPGFFVRTPALLADPVALARHLSEAEARKAASEERTRSFWQDEENRRLAPIRQMVASARAAYAKQFERK